MDRRPAISLTRAAIALAMVLLGPGCDLVFAPGSRATDGPIAGDGVLADSDPYEIDGNPLVIDAVVFDGDPAMIDAGFSDAAPVCEACWDPLGNEGTATCASSVIDHCEGFADYIDAVDLCSCTVGEPALYLFGATVPGSASAVLLTTNPTLDTSLLWHDTAGSSQCVPILTETCTDVDCAVGPRAVRIWEGVPLVPGENVFETHGGGQCGGGANRTFTITL